MSPELALRSSRVALRAAAAIVALAGGSVVVLGLGLVADDLSTRGEMFDGLGVVFGLVIGGVGAVVIGAAALCLWLVRRKPTAAAVIVIVVGVLVAGAGWVVVGGSGPLVAGPMILGGLLVAGMGFGGALVQPDGTIDSPGGSAR